MFDFRAKHKISSPKKKECRGSQRVMGIKWGSSEGFHRTHECHMTGIKVTIWIGKADSDRDYVV